MDATPPDDLVALRSVLVRSRHSQGRDPIGRLARRTAEVHRMHAPALVKDFEASSGRTCGI